MIDNLFLRISRDLPCNYNSPGHPPRKVIYDITAFSGVGGFRKNSIIHLDKLTHLEAIPTDTGTILYNENAQLDKIEGICPLVVRNGDWGRYGRKKDEEYTKFLDKLKEYYIEESDIFMFNSQDYGFPSKLLYFYRKLRFGESSCVFVDEYDVSNTDKEVLKFLSAIMNGVEDFITSSIRGNHPLAGIPHFLELPDSIDSRLV